MGWTLRGGVDAGVARATERGGSGGVDRADVVWRHTPDDLSPFSRGEGPGDVVRPTEHGPSVLSPVGSQAAVPESPEVVAVPVALSVRDSGTTARRRSEEHTSELQSLMRISYAVFCLKKKKQQQ